MSRNVESPTSSSHRTTTFIVGAIAVAVATTLPIAADVSALQEPKSTAESNLLNASAMAAIQADRLLIEQFFELELVATSVGDSSEDADLLLESVRTVYGRLASLSSGVLWFDEHGGIVFAEPANSIDLGTSADRITSGLGSDVRTVSMPFMSPTTDHVTAALSVPVYQDDGSRRGTLVGLLDLTEPLVTDLVEPARVLGSTGHADLIEERGLILALTSANHVLGRRDHPDLYDAIAQNRVPIVRRVAHHVDASACCVLDS